MIRVVSPRSTSLVAFVAASGGVKKGQLCKNSSGAAPVAAAHTGQTILGVAVDDYAAGAVAYMEPVSGAILEIDYYASSTLQTLTAALVGTLYDVNVDGSSGEMNLDLDDTTGAFLAIKDYDNVRKKALVMVPDSLIYLA